MKTDAVKALCAAVASLARCQRLLPLALVAISGVALAVVSPVHSRQQLGDSGLIAHEWGTFTAIAGADGQPVEWLPVDLVGKPELPTFVEHFRGFPKSVLRGTVRMETPVIYFYVSRETSVSVHVSFSKGFITEWYPHTSRLQPSTPIASDALYQPHDDGSVAWDSITVAPKASAEFPQEKAASRYYAARETSATPLSVQAPAGQQHEKFLFYRGVSTVLPTGGILFDNQAGQPIPALIVFERRGNKLGYHIVTAPSDHMLLETPAVSGTFESLRADLEDILASQGLYRDEAHAMLETWGDSWFEEGSRLIYIVPRPYLDSILPLSINPAPTQLARVFVGRIELITPATEKSIEAAIATRDAATLEKYGRFLYPIFDVIIAKQPGPDVSDHMYEELAAALAAGQSNNP